MKTCARHPRRGLIEDLGWTGCGWRAPFEFQIITQWVRIWNHSILDQSPKGRFSDVNQANKSRGLNRDSHIWSCSDQTRASRGSWCWLLYHSHQVDSNGEPIMRIKLASNWSRLGITGYSPGLLSGISCYRVKRWPAYEFAGSWSFELRNILLSKQAQSVVPLGDLRIGWASPESVQ